MVLAQDPTVSRHRQVTLHETSNRSLRIVALGSLTGKRGQKNVLFFSVHFFQQLLLSAIALLDKLSDQHAALFH